MERYTKKDVRAMYEQYAIFAIANGLVRDGHTLELQIGNSSYGYAWELMEISDNDRDRPLVGDSHLGMTAREAHHAIATRYRVAGDVLRLRGVTR